MVVNQVDVLRIELETDERAFGQLFNQSCDYLVGEVLPKIIDEELQVYQEKGVTVHLPLLTIDVGTLSATAFQRDYPDRFREALRRALASWFDAPHAPGRMVRQPEHSDWFDAWCTFLLTGRLPWHMTSLVRDLDHLFRHVLKHHALAFKHFLVRMGHVSSLRERLAAQFTDRQLLDTIALIHPSARDFLQHYVNVLTTNHEERPTADKAAAGEGFRVVVWQVILAYVLTDRSSFFDKKSFLRWTIDRLANQYNSNYVSLIRELSFDIERIQMAGSVSAELLLLLAELRSEVVLETDRYPHRAMVIRMLSTAVSTKNFIRGLSEPAVHALVYTVMETPPAAAFVIDYATVLDKQRDSLIGRRAGAAFRLLKWEIIFPLLTPYAMGGFNHRYFVRDVLSGIAAHYNLDVPSIARWLHGTLEAVNTNGRLRRVMDEWVATFSSPSVAKTMDHTDDRLWNADPSHWNRILGNIRSLRRLAQDLTEEQHARLVSLLYPDQATFLLAYAGHLNVLAHRSVGNAITDTHFTAVKWTFLYQAMQETRHQVFNKKGIAWRIIRGLAAHYHIAVGTLVRVLYEGLARVRDKVPFDLYAALATIYEEQQDNADHRDALQQLRKQLVGAYGTKQADMLQATLTHNRDKPDGLPYALLGELVAAEQVVYDRLRAIAGLRYDREKWMRLLVEIIRHPHRYNQQTGLWTWVTMLWKMAVAQRKGEELLRTLLELSKTVPLLADIADRMPSVPAAQEGESTFVDNAGLVILAPFLPRLFAQTGYLNGSLDGFLDRDSQVRAIFLMQYLVFGSREFPEYAASLDKLLCGFKTGIPIPRHIDLSEKEFELADGLLAAVLQHWKKLNTSTVEALRQAFLQRKGRLVTENDGQLHLHVESKSYDMLLDTLPWSLGVIRYRWMDQGLWVKWR